jgi:nitrous oxidase accessory protein NosD
MWRKNVFSTNEVYGLDPHDDSNNATIEFNKFIANGKHGFIVSKRCNYNVIKDNVSINNAGHGFMLHEKSDYNIMRNNISIANHDNFVIYGSSFNKISHNKSYNALGSQIRINQASVQNYVQDNLLYGGKKGVYLYGGINGAEVSGNTFVDVTYQLSTRGATRVLYTGNISTALGYQVSASDRVVFGVNTINNHSAIDLKPLEMLSSAKARSLNLTNSSAGRTN